ncbi:MAG: sulfur carrier protein ThiS [Mycobacteriales bacterium]
MSGQGTNSPATDTDRQIRVVVNGEARDVPHGMSLPELLTDLGLGVGWVVVELNGTALIRREVEAAVLHNGDVLELVRAVAGG